MFYSTRTTKLSFSHCYATERPYTDKNYERHNKDENFFIPTTLSDLKSITLFCQEPVVNFHTNLAPRQQAIIHENMSDFIKQDNIIGEESKWDSYIDSQLELLNKSVEAQGDKLTQVLKLAQEQLCSSEDIIKKIVFKEYEAYQNEQTLFWRYSAKGYNQDVLQCTINHSKISFGDSFLSGYINDGMFHSKIQDLLNGFGRGNFGACVFNYYDLHKQAIKVKADGFMTVGYAYPKNIPIEQLNDKDQQYSNSLNSHELYNLKLDDDALSSLIKHDSIHIPDTTISSSACYQKGEFFHPSICLSGSFIDFSSSLEVMNI